MTTTYGSKRRVVTTAVAPVLIAAGLLAATSDPAFALGFIFNQALSTPPTVHPGQSGVAVASYQIDTTNTFAIGQHIYLKIEGVTDPATTNAGVGFSTTPSVAATGPSNGAFGAGPAGDVAHDIPPAFTVALGSSAGAASVLGLKNEVIITLTNSSAGTAADHYTFSVTGIMLDIGSAVVPGVLVLHAYTGDGTGSLATPVTIAVVSNSALNRISGADRFGTAIATSAAEFPTAGSAGAVVLARFDDYPDALVGAALAAARTAPLLFANGGTLTPPTQAEVVRVLPAGRTVYLLGGTSAVPETVAALLSSLGYVVVRYGGADRYATALAVADALGDPSTVMLATGTNFPDALAAGPAAASVGGVVLLSAGSALTPNVSAYLTAHPGKVYAIGGPAIIAYPPATAVVGADRYATASAVATKFFTSPTTIGVASGVAFADALAGGALLAHKDGPLLLSDPGVLSGPTTSYLAANKATVTNSLIFGGTSAISSTVQTEADIALGL